MEKKEIVLKKAMKFLKAHSFIGAEMFTKKTRQCKQFLFQSHFIPLKGLSFIT